MGLFFNLLSAINNPNQQGSVSDLEGVINNVNQLGNNFGVAPETMQTVMSSLGGVLRSKLSQNNQNEGGFQVGDIVGQVLGGGNSSFDFSNFLTPEIIEGLTQKTGLNAGILQQMLPSLIPTVLNLLKMGQSTEGGLGGLGGIANNPLLKSFMDSDNDGDVDFGDVFKFGNRFLNPPNK